MSGHWESPDSFAYLDLTWAPPISRGRGYLGDAGGDIFVVTMTVRCPA